MTRLALLLTLLPAACASPAATDIAIPPVPVAGARMAPQPIPARLALPQGPGPFPAVILLHGCGGPAFSAANHPTQLEQWAARVTSWGYAALTPDSFAPRGLRTVCAPAEQPKATAFDRTGDTVSAALYLRTRPDIDPNRIAVIGFSHGGATAARVAIAPAATAHPNLIRAAIDYYGSCAQPARYTGTPLLALAGDADDWGNPATTCASFGRAIGSGKPFEQTIYPGVVHAFDSENLRTRITNQGHAMQYDDTAAQDSYRRVRAFLERYVK